MNPYLIQRCRIRDNVRREDIRGVDTLLTLDYMGSAEFEFGAVPQSLRETTARLDDYTVTDSGLAALNGARLFVLGRETDASIVCTWLAAHVAGRRDIRTKEWTGIREALRGEEGRRAPHVWWDIEYHWFAALGRERIDLVWHALDRLRERRIAEGKIK